ncbi:MAG: hypothetical protein IAG13_25030 [Deltaproteobacteria bacterium]|nr:hypothetical protein [Nannocystaceae bacterium]
MRRLLAPVLLASTLAGCGRTDVVIKPLVNLIEREVTLDDGDAVWLEVVVADDDALRTAVHDIEDGISIDGLVDTVAMGEPRELVFDTRDELALVIEVDGEPRAWVYR